MKISLNKFNIMWVYTCRGWLVLLTIICTGCVSSRKYRSAQAEIASIIADSAKRSTELSDAYTNVATLQSTNRDQQHQIEDLKKQIVFFKENFSKRFDYLQDLGPFLDSGKLIQVKVDTLTNTHETIPTINNPPPSSSEETEIRGGPLAKCKTYDELGTEVKSIFEKADQKHLFFQFDGGFACATVPRDYSIDGKEIIDASPEAEKAHISLISSWFSSIKQYYENLTTAEPIFTRFFVLIVSNKFNTIGEKEDRLSDFNKWFKIKRFEFPSDIGEDKPPGTKVYLLLYEFKQEANKSLKTAYSGSICKKHLIESSLYKNLIK